MRKTKIGSIKPNPGIINGISYLTLKTGIASDRILIFLPGIGAYKENYIQHALYLKDHYSAIHILDLPEQGSAGIWQIGTMVEQLADFIRSTDSNEIKHIDLSGHSAGALVIISFLANYNIQAEKMILDHTGAAESPEVTKSMLSLDSTGFATLPPEAEKVRRLILYAPPDSFDPVFRRKYSKSFAKRSEKFLKRTLDTVVNKPMILFRLFGSSRFFRFTREKSGKPQYFRLILNDHVRFMQYTSGYRTIFELYPFLPAHLSDRLRKNLQSKHILVQYGSNDWIVKSFRNGGRTYRQNIMIAENIQPIMHRFLGHMLNHRMRPDINLNLQMVTNRDIIERTIEFIKV